MGVSIHMNDSNFHIDQADKQAALKAARPVHGHWVKAGEGASCRTLEELLELWGYDAEVDDDGNATGLSLSAEKLGAEFEMFKAIAPYVKNGSFLEMGGDFGAWRWEFDGKTCKEKRPKW